MFICTHTHTHSALANVDWRDPEDRDWLIFAQEHNIKQYEDDDDDTMTDADTMTD